jgi:hypothetical protein
MPRDKQPVMKHPCFLIHDELNLHYLLCKFYFHIQIIRATMFSERDGPFSVKIEPTNGHEFLVKSPPYKSRASL